MKTAEQHDTEWQEKVCEIVKREPSKRTDTDIDEACLEWIRGIQRDALGQDPTKPVNMISLHVNVTQALAVLGSMQLALRHPKFKAMRTAQFVKDFAETLEKEICRLDPSLTMVSAAGWNRNFDR